MDVRWSGSDIEVERETIAAEAERRAAVYDEEGGAHLAAYALRSFALWVRSRAERAHCRVPCGGSEPVRLSIEELRYRAEHGTPIEREMARELIDLRARGGAR